MRLKIIDVQQGQTLWSIAEEHLGDGQMWRDVFVLNSVVLSENVGDEMAKTLKVLTAGTQLVVPVDDGDAPPFEPSGNA
jgi:hypothetical protein